MTDTTTRPGTTVALDIGGMTCASCAARITKRLSSVRSQPAPTSTNNTRTHSRSSL
jgi:cation transport ATPase